MARSASCYGCASSGPFHEVSRRRVRARRSRVLVTVGFAFARAPHDNTLQFHAIRTFGLDAVVVAPGWATTRLIAPRAAWLWAVDAAVIGLALLPSLLFALQFMVHHPPRQIADGSTVVAHFLPLMEHLSLALDRAWGA